MGGGFGSASLYYVADNQNVERLCRSSELEYQAKNDSECIEIAHLYIVHCQRDAPDVILYAQVYAHPLAELEVESEFRTGIEAGDGVSQPVFDSDAYSLFSRWEHIL